MQNKTLKGGTVSPFISTTTLTIFTWDNDTYSKIVNWELQCEASKWVYTIYELKSHVNVIE